MSCKRLGVPKVGFYLGAFGDSNIGRDTVDVQWTTGYGVVSGVHKANQPPNQIAN
jgi:hypothetical protein